MIAPSRRPRRLLALLAVVAVAGCGSGSAQPTAPGTSAAPPAASAASPAATPEASAEPLPADVPTPSISATPAGDAAQALVTVAGGGTLEASSSDGTSYTLVIPAGAVARDTIVTLQPLAGTTELGGVVAGADLAPVGTELALAGTLVVQLPGAAPSGAVVLGYTGDVASAKGRLLPGVGAGAAGGTLTIPVRHFSGALVVDATANAKSLYQAWTSAKPSDTPGGTQAVADTWLAAAGLAGRAGVITSSESAAAKNRAQKAWMDAELDRLRRNAEMRRLLEQGDTSVIGSLQVQFGAVYGHEIARLADGDTTSGTPDANEAKDATKAVLDEYEQHVKRAVDGLKREVSTGVGTGDYAVMEGTAAKIEAVAVVERELGELGADGAEVIGELIAMSKAMADGVRAGCKDASPSDALLASLRHSAVLEGEPGEPGSDLVPVGDCGAFSPLPSFDPNDLAADGAITYHATDGTGDYTVRLSLKIRTGRETLIFARGSRFSATWTFKPEPQIGEGGQPIPYTCPTSETWEGPVGTMATDGGWDPGSDAAPLANGFATGGVDSSLDIVLKVEFDPKQFPDGCTPPGVALECPRGQFLTGKLIGSRPPTWSFDCGDGSGSAVASVSGQLVRVVPEQ